MIPLTVYPGVHVMRIHTNGRLSFHRLRQNRCREKTAAITPRRLNDELHDCGPEVTRHDTPWCFWDYSDGAGTSTKNHSAAVLSHYPPSLAYAQRQGTPRLQPPCHPERALRSGELGVSGPSPTCCPSSDRAGFDPSTAVAAQGGNTGKQTEWWVPIGCRLHLAFRLSFFASYCQSTCVIANEVSAAHRPGRQRLNAHNFKVKQRSGEAFKQPNERRLPVRCDPQIATSR